MSESRCDECGVVSGLSNGEIVSGSVVFEATVLGERHVDEGEDVPLNYQSIVGGGGAVAGAREIAQAQDCAGGGCGLTLEDAPVSEWEVCGGECSLFEDAPSCGEVMCC